MFDPTLKGYWESWKMDTLFPPTWSTKKVKSKSHFEKFNENFELTSLALKLVVLSFVASLYPNFNTFLKTTKEISDTHLPMKTLVRSRNVEFIY